MTQEEIDELNEESLHRQRTRRDASNFLQKPKDYYQDIIRRSKNTKDKRLARGKLRELERQASESLRLAREQGVDFSDAQAELNRQAKDQENTGIDETGGGTNSTPKPALGGVEFNGSVLICINGSPYYINIPYDATKGAYASSEGADFPIEEPA